MISLQSNDYNLNRLITGEMGSFNKHMIGERRFRGNYIMQTYLGSAYLPFIFNNIDVAQQTYVLTDDDALDADHEQIINSFEQLNNDTLEFIMVYAQDPRGFVTEFLDNETLSNNFRQLNLEEKEIYTKALAQLKARDGFDEDAWPYFTALVSTEKHAIVLVTNYYDNNQATEYWLTFGMIPTFFQDFKDRFSVKELRYFDEFVHRSSLKRIVNSDVKRCFDDMLTDNKYTDRLKEIMYEENIKRIVQNRINNAQTEMERARSMSESALRTYRDSQTNYYSASRLLDDLKKNQADAVDEIKTALATEGIVDSTVTNDSIVLLIKSPVKFYEADESEIIINNIENDFIKYVFTKTFIDNEYKLNMLSRFYFETSLHPNNYNLTSSIDSNEMREHNALYNPHLQYFNCLGDYRPKLLDAIAKNDLLLFTNIAIASSGSLNFRDGAVMGRFIRDLTTLIENPEHIFNGPVIYCVKCFEDYEGNTYSLEDLYNKYQNPVEEETETNENIPSMELTAEEQDMLDAQIAAITRTIEPVDTIGDEGDDWLE